MILPDVNVLIYAFRQDFPQHAVCRPWLERVILSDARFGISPLALSALIRITTNPRAYKMPSETEEAFAFCEVSRRKRADPESPTPGSPRSPSNGDVSGLPWIATLRASRS